MMQATKDRTRGDWAEPLDWAVARRIFGQGQMRPGVPTENLARAGGRALIW
jgi:hypothetical protein